jgi:hypothetical protein
MINWKILEADQLGKRHCKEIRADRCGKNVAAVSHTSTHRARPAREFHRRQRSACTTLDTYNENLNGENT